MDDNTFIAQFRPRNPKQLIGKSQKEICQSLLERVEKNEILRRVMFVGSSGVGKTTLAEIYTRAVLGLEEDVNISNYIHYLNCSAETGIDHTRTILDSLAFGSFLSNYKIILMDEIHGLSKQAQNAWLTPLESLPQHVIVIACTTEEKKIIDTFKSRFDVYRLQSPSRQELQKKCTWVYKKYLPEYKDNSLSDILTTNQKTINEIIDRAQGNIRTLDGLLQQVIDGSYESYEDMTEDEQFFGRRLLFENWNVQRAFKEADKIEDYPGMVVGMCRYAIGVLKNSNNERAKKLLLVFGDGLSPNTDSKITFYSKLLEFLN